jgi:hypothetical protein
MGEADQVPSSQGSTNMQLGEMNLDSSATNLDSSATKKKKQKGQRGPKDKSRD